MFHVGRERHGDMDELYASQLIRKQAFNHQAGSAIRRRSLTHDKHSYQVPSSRRNNQATETVHFRSPKRATAVRHSSLVESRDSSLASFPNLPIARLSPSSGSRSRRLSRRRSGGNVEQGWKKYCLREFEIVLNAAAQQKKEQP